MITEVVWSTIKDDSRKDLKNSPLWAHCYREDEMTPSLKLSSSTWYVYQIKFDGLTPVQCTKFKEVKK